MAGQPFELLTGGAGMYTAVGQTLSPQNANGAAVGVNAGVQAHHSVIALVLIAVAVLFILDRVGFRFAVTTGRR